MSLTYFKKKQIHTMAFYGVLTISVFGSIFTKTVINKSNLESEYKILEEKRILQKEEILTTTETLNNLVKLQQVAKKLHPLKEFKNIKELENEIQAIIKAEDLRIKVSLPKEGDLMYRENSVAIKFTFSNSANSIRQILQQLVCWQNCLLISDFTIEGGFDDQHKCSVKALFVMGGVEL